MRWFGVYCSCVSEIVKGWQKYVGQKDDFGMVVLVGILGVIVCGEQRDSTLNLNHIFLSSIFLS